MFHVSVFPVRDDQQDDGQRDAQYAHDDAEKCQPPLHPDGVRGETKVTFLLVHVLLPML